MLSLTTSGSTSKTRNFLQSITSGNIYSDLESLAQRGVNALQAATPVNSGITANSWSYEIERKAESTSIHWINTNTNPPGGANIAILLQYGHATGTGGYVAGRDYINGSLKPIFDEIADSVWRRVTST